MKEKRGLDKTTTINFKELLENKDKLQKRKMVEEFNKNALKCPNLILKQEDPKTKVFWCKCISKGCHILRCPKNKDKIKD